MRDGLSYGVVPMRQSRGRFRVVEKVLCTNHLHRTRCFRNDGTGNRSKNHPPHATITMRTQHDEIGAPVPRFLYDHVLWDCLYDFRRHGDSRCGIADQLAGSFHERQPELLTSIKLLPL